MHHWGRAPGVLGAAGSKGGALRAEPSAFSLHPSSRQDGAAPNQGDKSNTQPLDWPHQTKGKATNFPAGPRCCGTNRLRCPRVGWHIPECAKTLFKSPFQSPNPKTTACSTTHLSARQPPGAPYNHEHKAVIVSGQGWALQRRSPRTCRPSPCESVTGVIAQRGTAIPQPCVCLLQPLEEKPKKSRKNTPRAALLSFFCSNAAWRRSPSSSSARCACTRAFLVLRASPAAKRTHLGRWEDLGISAFLAQWSGCSPSSAQFAKPQNPHKTSRKQARDLHEVFLNPKARGHTRTV